MDIMEMLTMDSAVEEADKQQQQQNQSSRQAAVVAVRPQPPLGRAADAQPASAVRKYRYMPYNEFKKLLRAMPHDISLEILDGLPAVDFNFPQEGNSAPTSSQLPKFVGRFSNEIDRRFIVYRRSVGLQAREAIHLSAASAEFVFAELKFVLQAARKINFSCSSFKKVPHDTPIVKFLNFLGTLRWPQLKAICLGSYSSAQEHQCDFIVSQAHLITEYHSSTFKDPNRLEWLVNVRSISHPNFPSNAHEPAFLSVLNRLRVYDCFDINFFAYALPIFVKEAYQLRELHLCGSRANSMAEIWKQLAALPALESLTFTTNKLDGIENNPVLKYLYLWGLHEATVPWRVLLTCPKLAHLSISFDRKPDNFDVICDVIKQLISRGQLETLLLNARFVLSVENLQQMGIGEHAISLRELQIIRGQTSSGVLDPTILTLISQCPRLECFSIEPVELGSEFDLQLEDFVTQGVLL